MKKIKLTKEQADAIDFALSDPGGYSHEHLIRSHSNKQGEWQTKELKALNELDVLELVDALRIGYEVIEAESDEDKLRNIETLWLPHIHEVCDEKDEEIIGWLIEQAHEKIEDEPYMSILIGKMNNIHNFLKGRSIDTSAWGKHIVDVLIEIIEQQDEIISDLIDEADVAQKELTEMKKHMKVDTSKFFSVDGMDEFKAVWKSLSDEISKYGTGR